VEETDVTIENHRLVPNHRQTVSLNDVLSTHHQGWDSNPQH